MGSIQTLNRFTVVEDADDLPNSSTVDLAVIASSQHRKYFQKMTGTKNSIQLTGDLLDTFLKLDALGLKTESKQAVSAIIDSVPDFNAKAAWTRNNLNRLPLNGTARIRHEIYQNIVFPALKVDFDRGDAEASYLLGKYWQNLVAANAIYKQMGEPSEKYFFRIAFESQPSSVRYRQAYLTSLLGGLNYVFHEWPAGILIDHMSWQEGLRELREEFNLVRSLDTDREYADAVIEWIESTDQYERRLAEKKERR